MKIITQLKLQNHQNTFQATSTTVLHVQNAQKNAKTRKNLEASYITLTKPDLNEQKTLKGQFYLEMIPHRAINDIMQTPKKEVHFSPFQFVVLSLIAIDN